MLDRKKISRVVGQDDQIIPDVRLIFAMNILIEEAVSRDLLLPDFVRRIKAYSISIPPLSERKEDIFVFVARECADYKPTPSFRLALLRHSWPGNVGELLDVLQEAKSLEPRTIG